MYSKKKADNCRIVEQAVPHILNMHKDRKAVMTPGDVLLWACFDAEAQNMVILQIINIVITAYQMVQILLEQTGDSIHKVPLVI